MGTKIVLILFCIFVFSACTQIVVKIPTSRLDSPEVLGEKFQASVGIAETRDVIVVSDASARPPIINSPSLSRGGFEIPIKANFAIAQRFEAGIRGGATFSSPWMLSGKFQILGDPRAKAKAYNFSLAATVALGYEWVSASGDQKGVFGPGGYKWKASVDTFVQDYALIAGYRLADFLLIYGGGYYAGLKMSGSIHDDRSDDGTSAAADYSLTAVGQNTGANLGVICYLGPNQTGFFSLEATWSDFRWPGLEKRSDVLFGGLVGVNF